MADDSRGGIPYYYQTKTGETVWERPDAFVIPLGILQASDLSPASISTPKLIEITRRTPRLLVVCLQGSAQALKKMVTSHPQKVKETEKSHRRLRVNDLPAGRRVLHEFPRVMVLQSRATQRGARNRPRRAQGVELPLQPAPLFQRRLDM